MTKIYCPVCKQFVGNSELDEREEWGCAFCDIGFEVWGEEE